MKLIKTLFLFLIPSIFSLDIYVHNYGIMNNEATTVAALNNGAAFNKAVRIASKGDSVIILENETLYYIPNSYDGGSPLFTNIQDIEICIDGKLIFFDEISAWPLTDNQEYFNGIDFHNSINITLTGNGIIDGQGWVWWWEFLIGNIVKQRPIMLNFEDCIDIKVEYLTLLNSPRFHVYGSNILNFVARHLFIYVNVKQQDNYYKQVYNKGYTDFSPPVFPFNTDGVDIAGVNIHIYNISVTNYDDAIVIKANKGSSKNLNGTDMSCTDNVLVEDIYVNLGVGLSIGSISAHSSFCIKNVIFQNIYAYYPIKFIYIKTGNLVDSGYPLASLDNVTYRNMTAYTPLLWPIYLGPQQQKEPNGEGAGLWPQTNPYVNITNIHFENIYIENSELRAGLLRCNISNPCKNITFDNVVVKNKHSESSFISKPYICDEPGTIFGSFDQKTNPSPINCGLEPY